MKEIWIAPYKAPTQADTEEQKPPSPDFEKANKTLFARACVAFGLDPEQEIASPYLQRLTSPHALKPRVFDVSASLAASIKQKGWL
jgi:hypothetical protein